jgi:hypothetical protein
MLFFTHQGIITVIFSWVAKQGFDFIEIPPGGGYMVFLPEDR